jgi:hypothetical protein
MQHPVQKLFAALIYIVAACAANAQERRFVGEGSDTMMGVGGRYVAMAGTSAAIGNDIYSIFSNPAGLAKIEDNQLSLARQLNAELSPVNFAGAAFSLPYLNGVGIKTVVGISYIPRLHFSATGTFTQSDLESVFLRYALPGISGDFSGDVVSKTKDFRFALAFAPLTSGRWALGLSVGLVDCATFTCGGEAESVSGYTMATTEATAITLNLGASYKLRDDLTVAVSIKDVHTRLDVHVETTLLDGSIEEVTFEASLPTDLTVGLLWNYSDTLDLALDYQTMFGSYSTHDIDVRMLRLGAEKRYDSFSTRYGLVVPIAIKSSKLPDIKLPFPVAPTFGLGWKRGNYDIDLAIYAHPLMSYSCQTIYPAADLSLTYSY